MGIGIKIPLGEKLSSNTPEIDITTRLRIVKFPELGIIQSTSLDDLVSLLLGFQETPFVTYIWVDNESTYQLWLDLKNRVNTTYTETYLSYGNLMCKVCNGVIHFKFESLLGEVTEFIYTNKNSIGFAGFRTYIGNKDDTTNNIISFSSKDTENATDWMDVDVLNTNETHSSILNKISIMFNNIRWIKSNLDNNGSEDEIDPTALTPADINEATETEWDGSSSTDETALSREDINEAVKTEWDGSTSTDETALSSSDIEDATD